MTDAAPEPSSFAPGESQHYSNTNYILLGMIIEEATGRPWRQQVRQRIFEPLNLEDTLLPAPEESMCPPMTMILSVFPFRTPMAMPLFVLTPAATVIGIT